MRLYNLEAVTRLAQELESLQDILRRVDSDNFTLSCNGETLPYSVKTKAREVIKLYYKEEIEDVYTKLKNLGVEP